MHIVVVIPCGVVNSAVELTSDLTLLHVEMSLLGIHCLYVSFGPLLSF